MEDKMKNFTDEELDSFSVEDSYITYIKEIKQYRVLTTEEQKRIAEHYIKHRDKKSRELLINSNLLLVVSIAKKYCYSVNNLSLLDIIQEGNLGLIRAVETYNPNESAFSTYATYWIEQSIKRSIASKEKIIRKPVHLEEIIRRYKQLLSEYANLKKPLPSDEVICAKLNISELTLENIRVSLSQKIVSLNIPINEEGDSFLEEIIPDNSNVIEEVTNKIYEYDLCALIKDILSPRDYYVIYKRFFSKEQLKLEQIANLLDITRERVRQIQNNGLKTMKSFMMGNQLKFSINLKYLKEREGVCYDYLKLEPIIPEQIMFYYYIKDNLTILEDTLYRLKYFSKYRIPNYALYLGISESEYANLNKSLSEKMYIDDKIAYLQYQKQMIKTYGKNIFDLINNKGMINDSITLKRCLKSS